MSNDTDLTLFGKIWTTIEEIIITQSSSDAPAAPPAPPAPAAPPASAAPAPNTPSEEPASDEHTLLAAAQALASINSNEGTHDDAVAEPKDYDDLSVYDKEVVSHMRNNKHLLKFIYTVLS